LRLIRAAWAPLLLSLALTGCGGSDVAVNGTPTANETGPVTATAKVSWTPPTKNTDGSPLDDLAGYNIYYGTEPSALTQTIQIQNAAALSYVVSGLAKGTTWYFAVTSYSAAGQESARSLVTSKTT
jgi:fibronectin type III domain protein